MGIKGERVKKDAAIIREIFYKDGYACKTVEEYQYDTYILDNKTNEQVLDGMLNTEGIQLCISPTGSGKTASFLNLVKQKLYGMPHDTSNNLYKMVMEQSDMPFNKRKYDENIMGIYCSYSTEELLKFVS